MEDKVNWRILLPNRSKLEFPGNAEACLPSVLFLVHYLLLEKGGWGEGERKVRNDIDLLILVKVHASYSRGVTKQSMNTLARFSIPNSQSTIR